MEAWYKIATPRKEVREGRSFNPDEFAIHLEQVIARTASEDYREPKQFFARTCFTRALREHAGMVLRRLSGETANTTPVMTFITQFGGGKTHTLTALYHLAVNGAEATAFSGVDALIREAGMTTVPEAVSPPLWAMHGTRRRGGRRHGSMWQGSLQEIRASRSLALRPRPHRRGQRRSLASSRRQAGRIG